MGVEEAPALPDVGTDTLFDGRLRLRQLRRGHRAGTDAVLLAAAARVDAGESFVDVGAGVGTVGLALALRTDDLSGVLLEADPVIADLAAQNCRLNGVEARVRAATCDLFDAAARRGVGLDEGKADVVVTNPPFYTVGDGRASDDPRKAKAYHLGDAGRPLGHADWLRAALSLLAPKGRFYAIHRPEALQALLAACEGRLGGVAVMPVHAKADGMAIRVLLVGVKGSRAPMRLCPPLILHGPDGAFTPQAEALHRGETLLSMSERFDL